MARFMQSFIRTGIPTGTCPTLDEQKIVCSIITIPRHERNIMNLDLSFVFENRQNLKLFEEQNKI